VRGHTEHDWADEGYSYADLYPDEPEVSNASILPGDRVVGQWDDQAPFVYESVEEVHIPIIAQMEADGWRVIEHVSQPTAHEPRDLP